MINRYHSHLMFAQRFADERHTICRLPMHQQYQASSLYEEKKASNSDSIPTEAHKLVFHYRLDYYSANYKYA